MASFVGQTTKAQLKIAKTIQTLGLNFWELMPNEYLTALNNALKCERETARIMPIIDKKKQELKDKQIIRTSRVTFGKVTEFLGNKRTEAEVSFETSPKEMASALIFEKFASAEGKYGIFHIISSNSQNWTNCGAIGSTFEGLREEARIMNISMDQIRIDLRMIYNYFRHDRVAILGYKSSWKLKRTYQEYIFDPYHRIWSSYPGGKTHLYAPNIRLYLLKVIKDEELAATIIQTMWRQYRDKTLLTLLKAVALLIKTLYFQLNKNMTSQTKMAPWLLDREAVVCTRGADGSTPS